MHSWNETDSDCTEAIRRPGVRKSQDQGYESSCGNHWLQVSDDLASEGKYGCGARVAPPRDQTDREEN
jgi:hypothetical protein